LTLPRRTVTSVVSSRTLSTMPAGEFWDCRGQERRGWKKRFGAEILVLGIRDMG
jgi:hypothetical protein